MQSHAADTFQKATSSRPEISLLMTNGTENRTTDILYMDAATTGWDNGYDSSIFEGVENTFQLYTQAVENGTGRNLGIQSLPTANYENMIVPVGLKATTEKELTFAVNATNLPEGLMVFLEDRVNNTIVRLDETGSTLNVSLDADQNGTGRFYLRTSMEDITQTLNVDGVHMNNVHVFMAANRTSRVTGLNSEQTQVRIHSILGKTILDQQMGRNNSINMTVPGYVKPGIYIVSVITENGSINKKLFIQ
jgi:hypothetical protein